VAATEGNAGRVASRDWVFIGFVAFAAVMALYTGVQRVRYKRVIAAFAACVAQADTECASRKLEEARVIDAEHLRTRIGQAQLRVLFGDADQAERVLLDVFSNRGLLSRPPARGSAPNVDVDADALGKVDAAARGDLLLLEGDIAAARGQSKRAEMRWGEAAILVDEATLVRPRRDRLSGGLATKAATASSDLEQLRQDFETLFAAADAAQTDTVQLLTRDLRDRVGRLKNDAAQQRFGVALDAATRAMGVAKQRKGEIDSMGNSPFPRPEPPSPLDPAHQDAFSRRLYEQRLADYQRSLQRWQTQQSERESRASSRAADLTSSVLALLAQGRAAVQDGIQAAQRGQPAAVGDAPAR
jgi:hypothetical protein